MPNLHSNARVTPNSITINTAVTSQISISNVKEKKHKQCKQTKNNVKTNVNTNNATTNVNN